MKKTNLTKDNETEIINMYKNNISLYKISIKFHIDTDRVHKILKQNNIPKRTFNIITTVYKNKRCSVCNKWFRPKAINSLYCGVICRNKQNQHRFKTHVYPLIKQHAAQRQRENRRAIREEILKKLGNKCQSCGIDDIRLLQIDHKNGGGTQHRKKGNHYSYYKSIRDNIEGYQILCPNCNWLKRYGEITW